MLALAPTKPTQLGSASSILDSIVSSVTGTAVSAATAASGPLLDDIERRVKGMLLPIVLLTAGSLMFTMLTYREVRKKSRPLSGRHR